MVNWCSKTSGWWFQPLWKIWKSMGRIIPYIIYYGKMFETTNQLYDVYCMVMMTIGVFIAHKMLHQIGLCYSYPKNMVKSAYSHHSFWMSNPRPSSHRPPDRRLRRNSAPLWAPADVPSTSSVDAATTETSLKPPWEGEISGNLKVTSSCPKKNKSTAKSLGFFKDLKPWTDVET